MDLEMEIRTPLEHPCYAGHFPGDPIVPGVLLLDLIVEALDRGAPRHIGSVKFHHAVRPGDAFTLRSRFNGETLSFRGVVGERLLLEGTLSFGSRPGAGA
jgi:3-hydroxymyristoyl/3-hydroxydecanoyl-(acyl carrier protein) dehydratase